MNFKKTILNCNKLCLLVSLYLILNSNAYASSSIIEDAIDSSQFLIDNAIFILCGIIIIANSIYLCLNYKQINKKDKELDSLSFDELTQLPSMRAFKDKVQEILKSSQANKYEMISIDIDDFRTINNYYGIEKSIVLIAEMGKALEDAYGNKDIPVTRESAEHFLIFAPSSCAIKLETVIEEYIKPSIREITGQKFIISVSAGVYQVQKNEEEFDSIVNYANIARLKAKQGAGIELFTKEMYVEHQSLRTIIERMEQAFEDKEFQVVFQPRINLGSKEINGIEAFARWHPPLRHEAVFPNTFIPIMEKNSAIVQLDLYILEEVCKFIHKNSKSYNIPRVAVNFSAHTLSNSNLLKNVMAILEKYSVEASQIEIDINEKDFNEYENILLIAIKILKKIGFTVAIDDFGVNLTSLNKLPYLNADIVKLDRDFIVSHYEHKKGIVIVEEIIKLAKRLGMQVTAEGIENKEHAAWLNRMYSDNAQGYYFEKPMLEENLLEVLTNNKQYSFDE